MGLTSLIDEVAFHHRRLLPSLARKILLHRRFTPATDLVSIRTLALSRELVFPAQRVFLHDIQSYSNVEPQSAADWAYSYQPREAVVEDITIVRLPADTRVSGALGFAVMADGLMVAEQQVAVDAAMLPHLAYGFRAQDVTVHVSGDAMLVARYGEGTWGHWIGELLPKIAVCERVAPGRFKYVMAEYVLQDAVLGARIRESCAAYGVTESRFIRVPDGEQYSFSRLYAMTPVISDGTLHPQVKQVLVDDIQVSARSQGGSLRLNLIRGDGRRSIVNAEVVYTELAKRGFETVDLATLSFPEQVYAFRLAIGLFSVLGSSLTGLVYSPAEMRVVAAAPAEWPDDFFYGVLRASPTARWAEVRGPIVDRHPEHLRFSSFRVDHRVLCAGLDSVGL